MPNQFKKVAINKKNKHWNDLTIRQEPLYEREGDLRNCFERDYNRILHSKGYRRLKHKTQVFFATHHDHVCTRMEHVNHVASISNTIARNLGLNSILTNAIASGHDLGHAPFGHHGETVLKKLCEINNLSQEFWHEKNSLHFIDNLETLQDPKGNFINLSLTYAVRDGVICHCGEIDENSIYPRKNIIDLNSICKPGEVQPITWEGCVVKISDKISYLGRDIEDALLFKILDKHQIYELRDLIRKNIGVDNTIKDINNTVIINDLVNDLCSNSKPEKGLKLSDNFLKFMTDLKKFNYDNIYKYWKVEHFKNYATLIIETIYQTLMRYYENREEYSLNSYIDSYPYLFKYFENWIIKYTDYDLEERRKRKFKNKIVYDLNVKDSFISLIIDFISSMTDQFAIKVFNEIISF
ncbi:MAG: HD domain-containing protein [Candidatus Lokiarchaeota archaeon]|nr:HD domain-containing protein [Candidatus Lokiarchaeota archaeon]